jgi:photosystem II stability/assembly factor-like uncharacterized protein
MPMRGGQRAASHIFGSPRLTVVTGERVWISTQLGMGRIRSTDAGTTWF